MSKTHIATVLGSQAYDILLFLRNRKKPARYTDIANSFQKIPQGELTYFLHQLRNHYLVTMENNVKQSSGYLLSERSNRILNHIEKSIITYQEMEESEQLHTYN